MTRSTKRNKNSMTQAQYALELVRQLAANPIQLPPPGSTFDIHRVDPADLRYPDQSHIPAPTQPHPREDYHR